MSYQEARAARREARAQNTRKVAEEQGARMADLDVLRCDMKWNDFASSMVAQFDAKGSLSDRQWPWVHKLAAEQRERNAKRASDQSPGRRPQPAKIEVPNTVALFAPDRFSRFDAMGLSYRRKNDGSCAWLKDAPSGDLIGRLDVAEGAVTLFSGRVRKAGLEMASIAQAVREIEADPLAAAKETGLLTGRCSCCGRELTDPASIEIGIGPICLGKMGG